MAYTGLKGIQVQYLSKTAQKPLVGLLGITLELEANLPIKVQDRAGKGVADVLVTVTNPTGIPSVGFTDALGNVLLQADSIATNPVNVVKNKAFATKNFSTGMTQLIIILDPPILYST